MKHIKLKSLLPEARDYNIKSFADLPDKLRYGFLIWPDLTIGVVNTPEGHGNLMYSTIKKNPIILGMKIDPDNWDVDFHEIFDKAGGLSLVHEDEVLWTRGPGNRKTLKLAKDIAAMYGLEFYHDPKG